MKHCQFLQLAKSHWQKGDLAERLFTELSITATSIECPVVKEKSVCSKSYREE
jgi:hypothetical protein